MVILWSLVTAAAALLVLTLAIPNQEPVGEGGPRHDLIAASALPPAPASSEELTTDRFPAEIAGIITDLQRTPGFLAACLGQEPK